MDTIQPYGISQRKDAWCRFLNRETSPKHLYLIDYSPDGMVRPPLWPSLKEARIDWAYDKYCRHLKRIEWLRDDSIPFLDCLSGTEIFAEAFGCKIHRPEDNMPFALPLIHSAAEVSAIKVPTLLESSLAIQFDIADELIRRAGKGTLLKLPDIQSPMDIASLIWDKNTFYMALIEAPEAVMELSSKVATLLKAFLDEWFRRYGKEFIAHFPDYYMPFGITLSEDEVGVVSQEMFDAFFLPELTELSERYGAMGMHCCADARHQWDNFKKIPNLKLINFAHKPKYITKAYPYFASEVAQMHSWCGDGDPSTWVSQYPPNARVVLSTSASTKDEALRLSDALRAQCE